MQAMTSDKTASSCSSASLIVCEKTGSWAIAIRRVLASSSFVSARGDTTKQSRAISQTRSLAGCLRALAVCPASLVALELTEANVEEVAERLIEIAARYPAARVVLLTTRAMQHYEWLLREMGAVHLLFSVRQVDALIQIAARHFATVPEQEMSALDRVWMRLP